MQHILVVEDEPQVAQVLKRGLTYKGFSVNIATSGETALENIRNSPQDLVVLDVMLPGMNGFEVCHRLRSLEYKQLPILMLTARDGLEDKIAGLESGADDYITKPFEFEELLARIRAALRRIIGRTHPTRKLEVGDLVLDPESRQAWRDGHLLELTKREYDLLELLAWNAGRVLTKGRIFERVWGYDNEAGLEVIKVYMNYLRTKKLLDIHSGYTIGRSPNLGRESIPLNATDFQAALHGQQVFSSYQDGSGQSVRLFMLSLRDSAQRVVLIAQISTPLTPIEQLRNLLLLLLSLGTFFGTLIAYILCFLLTTHELRPLRALSITLRDLSTQGLGKQIPQQSAVIEVRLLIDAFNQMSERLEASFVLQHNFVADISHELRTPLTTLRGQAEVLLLNAELEEDTREDVQKIRTELERLSRLVNNLLTIARAEVGVPPSVMEGRSQLIELDALLISIHPSSSFYVSLASYIL